MMSTTTTARAHKKLAMTLAVMQPNAEACGDSGMGNPLSAAISTSFSIVANGGMTLRERREARRGSRTGLSGTERLYQ
jgi:hypothetical protein